MGGSSVSTELPSSDPTAATGISCIPYKALPGAEQEIYNRIGDITISMKAVDHLKMPELISTEYPVTLDEKERQRYEDMKKDLILDVPEHEVTAANAAALSGKLSQMANGAVYADDDSVIRIHDRKLDALEDIIESANGRPILVAYWYKHDLERITKLLDKLKVEYARISSPGSIEMWNRGGVCRWAYPSGICGTRSEPPGGRQPSGVVRSYLVFGVIPADQCQTVPAGPEVRHRCGTAHYRKGQH